MREQEPLLDVRNLRVTFQVFRGQKPYFVRAVRGIHFSLFPGEVLGMVGESGSGKSAAAQAIPGLLPANAAVEGSVYYRGTSLRELRARELRAFRGRKIGVIYQEPGRSFDPLQSMEKVFLETLRSSNPAITRTEAAARAARLLEETGLENGRERLRNFPHQFSGGQLQRISIALALAGGCELLIADEPTTALDVTIQRQIVELLKTLQKKRNISIIFISHDIDLVADISGRIMVMYGGLVMEAGRAASISASPWHPYTKALLAASPRFGSHYSRERLVPIPGKIRDGTEDAPESGGCPFAPRCAEASAKCETAFGSVLTHDGGDGEARNASHEIRCIRYGGET
ncbi:MAG: ABC transporter ATP-binding protein [Spirochaetaceae bacterium]|jgi:peptide/nickel transport system permease protein|nr:ABC transporter ATP-binding protein [Spirochaetaceae bacterium]